jgi:hypothetical protein
MDVNLQQSEGRRQQESASAVAEAALHPLKVLLSCR